MLEQETEWKAAEQVARLARIRAKIRAGVWALHDNSALPAHWEALERGEVAGSAAAEPDADAVAEAAQR